MQELQIFNDGALLIHNGIIQESGPDARIATLQRALRAREIDGAWRVVMPAFVDPVRYSVSRAPSDARPRRSTGNAPAGAVETAPRRDGKIRILNGLGRGHAAC